MIDVTVLILAGNYASTSLGPIEVFHAAGSLWNDFAGTPQEPRFRVTTASLNGDVVASPYPIGLVAERRIDEVEDTDIVIVPASGLELDAQLERHAALKPWLRARYEAGAYIASTCTGSLYLAEAGLLDGRRATTHWAVADELARRYPNVDWQPELFITEDGRVLCSGGVAASVDLSIYLVEKFCGREVALQCAKSLLVDMPRSRQSSYAVLPLARPHNDERIHVVEAHIDSHYAENLTAESLAAIVNMSPRNFIRRFKAATGRLPGNYVQTLRINIAREMLESTQQSIQTIGFAVGYEDVGYFRALFKRHTGVNPGDYRSKFGRMIDAA